MKEMYIQSLIAFNISAWWFNIDCWVTPNKWVPRSSCSCILYYQIFTIWSKVNDGFHCSRHKHSPDQYVGLQRFDTNYLCASCEIQLFSRFLRTFSKYRQPEICILWKCNFDLPNWLSSSSRSSFLVRAEFWRLISPSLFPSAGSLSVILLPLLRINCFGLGWRFASVSWRGMKHHSDPILDSTGCHDHPNLSEDLSSHSTGSFRSTFLNSLGHGTLLSVWKKMAARKHLEIHDIQQTKKMVPLITCEVPLVTMTAGCFLASQY